MFILAVCKTSGSKYSKYGIFFWCNENYFSQNEHQPKPLDSVLQICTFAPIRCSTKTKPKHVQVKTQHNAACSGFSIGNIATFSAKQIMLGNRAEVGQASASSAPLPTCLQTHHSQYALRRYFAFKYKQ